MDKKNNCRRSGFTLLELMIVIGIIGILAALYLPAMSRAKAKATQSNCIHQLKQIGIAFTIFANEHGTRYPMQVGERHGGTLEHAGTGSPEKHFQVLSNLLENATLLHCGSDRERTPTNDWNGLGRENLSYFVGLDARFGEPHHILAGDRNLILPPAAKPNNVAVLDHHSTYVRWGHSMHRQRGQILFADGHAESLDDRGLLLAVKAHSMD